MFRYLFRELPYRINVRMTATALRRGMTNQRIHAMLIKSHPKASEEARQNLIDEARRYNETR